jgi:hypothetical protein
MQKTALKELTSLRFVEIHPLAIKSYLISSFFLLILRGKNIKTIIYKGAKNV